MKRKQYSNHTKIYKYQYIIGCLLGSIFFAIPLIVFLRVVPLSHELLSYYPTINGYIVDLSLFYKSRAFVFVATSLFLIFIGERIYPEQKVYANILKNNNKKYLLSSLLFIACIVISFLFSENKSISLWGAPNSYEGTLIWISYLTVFLISLNYFENHFYYKFIKSSVVFIMIVFCLFGLFEYFVTSPLETPLFQYLILSRDYWNQIGNLNLTSYFGNISLTLSNPSYVGQFLVLILPILFTIGQKSEHDKKNYILLRLLSGMSVFLLLLSGATAALYAFVIGLIIQLILHKRNIRKQIISSLLITASLVVIILPFQNIGIFSDF
ncbi:hypothetical protein [Alkalibaculum bacchi]|uniref:hypothetical protein n=1 Tax=Alkalibaculum bacchi TaxID=645887 RepID=UPI0026ECA429|nr:hypothetical protein [Alkalibaculum bacchi]